ncbi:MAG: polyamine aminopropyltransferase, partial [Betaproteobacteria bacterium]
AGGALVMHIGSPFAHAARVARSIAELRSVFARVTAYFVHIPVYGAVWGFALASDSLDAQSIDALQADARLAARRIGLRQFYNGAMHQALFALPEFIRESLRPAM